MPCGALRVSAVLTLLVLAAVGACAQTCYEYTPTSCWFGLQSGRRTDKLIHAPLTVCRHATTNPRSTSYMAHRGTDDAAAWCVQDRPAQRCRASQVSC